MEKDILYKFFDGKASREEKVVSADGHRQRAGTVPKRGGAGGCAAD